GPGIENDKLPHIFERFYRADSSRTNGKNKGYGLGLALAKNIVELHKGRLFVSSTPGEETTFSFLLPLVKHSKLKIS
ncbi:MAG: HAMP domain-containing sensor histidine kinase, partial [Candidatus Saccharimonadaceae bacterium]|nr:HAMP domain-containing sensor histidine kinase [Candidatus Saccharimonadaceae bacterium]